MSALECAGRSTALAGRVQIVDQRTPIEGTAKTAMFNGILQAEDGKRIRVEITEAGRKGGSSGFGTSPVSSVRGALAASSRGRLTWF